MLPIRIYNQPITCRQGEQRTFNLIVKINEVAIDLTNCEILCNIRTRSQSLIAIPTLAVIDAALGKVTVSVTKLQTTTPGAYFYDFWIYNSIEDTVIYSDPNPFTIYPVATVTSFVEPIPTPTPNQHVFEEINIVSVGQTVFVLSDAPNPLLAQVFLNGEKLDNGSHYTISDNILTWLSDIVLDDTDNFEIYYL